MPFKDKKKAKEYGTAWMKRKYASLTQEQRRRYILKGRYGITPEQWDAIFQKQGFRCAICRRDKPTSKVGWHTDHDHETKKIRGILCENCNRGLGMFLDDISFMVRAREYLGIHSGVFTKDTISTSKIITPCLGRGKAGGVSYGNGFAGYDIRLDQTVSIGSREFKLASSMEHFDMPLDAVGMVFDKSTLARRGLSLFNTIIEPGWRGYLTLEIVNHSTDHIILEAGSGIAQVVFIATDKPVERGYDGKYQDQPRGPQEAIIS